MTRPWRPDLEIRHRAALARLLREHGEEEAAAKVE